MENRLTLDAREVKEMSGLALSTVFEKAKAGEIPGTIYVGRRLLFNRAKILAWLEGEERSNDH